MTCRRGPRIHAGRSPPAYVSHQACHQHRRRLSNCWYNSPSMPPRQCHRAAVHTLRLAGSRGARCRPGWHRRRRRRALPRYLCKQLCVSFGDTEGGAALDVLQSMVNAPPQALLSVVTQIPCQKSPSNMPNYRKISPECGQISLKSCQNFVPRCHSPTSQHGCSTPECTARCAEACIRAVF